MISLSKMTHMLMKFFNVLKALGPPLLWHHKDPCEAMSIAIIYFLFHFEFCEDALIVLCAPWKDQLGLGV